MSPAVAEDLSLARAGSGVAVAEVAPASAAAEAGLEKGDVITDLDGTRITSTRQFERATGGGNTYYRLTLQRAGRVLQTEIGG